MINFAIDAALSTSAHFPRQWLALAMKGNAMKKILLGIIVVSMLVIIGIATTPSIFAQPNNSGSGYSIGAPPKQTPAQTQSDWIQQNGKSYGIDPSKGGNGGKPGNGANLTNPPPKNGK